MAVVKAYKKRVKKVETEQEQFLQQKKARREKRRVAKKARRAEKAETKENESDSDTDNDDHDDDEQKVLKAAERERVNITYLLVRHSNEIALTKSIHLSRNMTKLTKCLCVQRRLRSDWASAQSAQSDQSLRCALNA